MQISYLVGGGANTPAFQASMSSQSQVLIRCCIYKSMAAATVKTFDTDGTYDLRIKL